MTQALRIACCTPGSPAGAPCTQPPAQHGSLVGAVAAAAPGPHCCGHSGAPASQAEACLQRREAGLWALEEAPAAGQGPPVQGLAPGFAGQGAPCGAGAHLLEGAAAYRAVEALEGLNARLAAAEPAEVTSQVLHICKQQVSVTMLGIACQRPVLDLGPVCTRAVELARGLKAVL